MNNAIPKFWMMAAFYSTVLLCSMCGLTIKASAQQSSSSHSRGEADSSSKETLASQLPAGITREQADAILFELRAIRDLLQKQSVQDRILLVPANQSNEDKRQGIVQLSIANHPYSLGREDAPATLVEFTDFQCPSCRLFHAEVFPALKREYIDTGRIRFISLDLPLAQHPEAAVAAEAVRCAGDQGKYWEVRAALLSDSGSLSERGVLQAAHSASLDADKFQSCLFAHEHKKEVQEDLADAAFLDINGTPTFVLGRIVQGKLEGILIKGAVPYVSLQAKIEAAIKAGGQ